MARVLIIGPHPDDQEIGMGGTIALLHAQGHDVLIGDMTDGCPERVDPAFLLYVLNFRRAWRARAVPVRSTSGPARR